MSQNDLPRYAVRLLGGVLCVLAVIIVVTGGLSDLAPGLCVIILGIAVYLSSYSPNFNK